MTEALLKDAPRKPTVADADAIVDSLDIDWRALISILAPEFFEEGRVGVAELIDQLGLEGHVSWDDVAPDVQAYADNRAAELVGMHRMEDGRYVPSAQPGMAITETTREMLRDTVRQAIAEGWTANDIQRHVMEQHAFSPARALNIARTETAFARNQGGLIAAKQSGVIKAKRWDADPNACDVCLELAGEEAPLDQEFSNGSSAPPGHPNCECSLGYVLTEEAA